VKAVGRERTAIRIAPFHILQQTLDSDRISTFARYAENLEKRHLGYIHIVEPRYDQLSTEGAFSGNIERQPGAGGDADTCEEREEVKAGNGDGLYSLWTFRKILKTTPLIGAGGYNIETARSAIAEGKQTDPWYNVE
jgi:12-oxophytodienoic acid reductase